jgi:4'-phosphopantetheinyl transferase EntD
LLDETRIEDALASALGVPISAAVAAAPIEEDLLTEDERRRYAEVGDTSRCDSWLRGRAALKHLLARIGESPDTARLEFPHPRLSLSHCGRYAVAIASPAAATSGMGVDLELRREVPADAARFFLSVDERRQLPLAPGRELLRLWTVKEAVFKADLGNAGRGLLDYHLADTAARQGLARVCGGRAAVIRYASLTLPGGFLSAAVVRRLETEAVA